MILDLTPAMARAYERDARRYLSWAAAARRIVTTCRAARLRMESPHV